MYSQTLDLSFVRDCKRLGCTNRAEAVCKSHGEVYCHSCLILIHASWEYNHDLHVDNILSTFAVIRSTFSRIEQISEAYNLNWLYPGYNDDLEKITSIFNDFWSKAKLATESKDPLLVSSLFGDVNNLKATIDSSEAYSRYCKFIDNQSQLTKFSEDVEIVLRRLEIDKLFTQTSINMASLLTESNKKDINREKQRLDDYYKNLYEKKLTEDTLKMKQEREQFKVQMDDKYAQVVKEKEKLQMELIKVKGHTQRSEQILLAMPQKQILEVLFSVYFDEEKVFDEESTLVLDMSKDSSVALVQHLSKNKVKLPNIRKLKIDNIGENDEQIKQLFIHCFPDKLELFGFNENHNSRLNLNNYIDGLCHLLPTVTTQIFFYWWEVKDSSVFGRLVSASHNASSLVLRCSELALDQQCIFADIPYNIKTLSFGYKRSGDECKWASNPKRFENIVKSIADSPLKDSLTDIQINDSCIKVDKASEYLNDNGCSHIKLTVGYSGALK